MHTTTLLSPLACRGLEIREVVWWVGCCCCSGFFNRPNWWLNSGSSCWRAGGITAAGTGPACSLLALAVLPSYSLVVRRRHFIKKSPSPNKPAELQAAQAMNSSSHRMGTRIGHVIRTGAAQPLLHCRVCSSKQQACSISNCPHDAGFVHWKRLPSESLYMLCKVSTSL